MLKSLVCSQAIYANLEHLPSELLHCLIALLLLKYLASFDSYGLGGRVIAERHLPSDFGSYLYPRIYYNIKPA